MNERLILLAGPTASGKSALALELAPLLDAEIVNADSQQVYRGLDIGTGKPTRDDQAQVPHHLYDIADPWEQLDVARFIGESDRVVAEIRSRGRVPLFVGGTGLWLRALIRGLVDAPPRNPELRRRIDAEAEAVGWPALHERLRGIDPVSASRIQPTDPVRIQRALEVFELSGARLSDLHAEHASMPPRYEAVFLGLDVPTQGLHERIDARVRAMFEGGLAEETLTAARDPRSLPKLERLMGYREALLYSRGALTLPDAIERAAKAQRQYARRQRTWFKAEPQWQWLPSSDPIHVAALVRENLTRPDKI